MSIKFQITLPDALAGELKREAQRRNAPLAEWIRQTMENELRKQRSQASRDALEWLDQLAVSEPEADVAGRVDELLYGSSGLR